MQPEWLRVRERGSVLAYRLIASIARRCGRRLTRGLLFPICLYYMARSPATRRASRQYLEKVLGRRPTWREVFRHHYWFGATLLDRVYLYDGITEKVSRQTFDVRDIGGDVVSRLGEPGGGQLMLSAHIGSHEFGRTFSLRHRTVVNIMMYEENAQKIGAVAQALDRGYRQRIIPIGHIDALITAKERLDRGELIGILGDRLMSEDTAVRVRFLGQEASFPAGPFLAAAVLKVPVILFFCLYRGGNRYDLHFERFADVLTLDRRNPADLQKWVQRYAERLEHYCRIEPYNWFNFYNFWGDE